MSRKTVSGADFKAFYSDPKVWDYEGKPGWYVDDFLIHVDGNNDVTMDELHARYGDGLEKLPDQARVSIESGYIDWQGPGPTPAGFESDLQRRFDQWLDERAFVTFVATMQVPKDNREMLARIQEVLEGLGAKVVRSDDPAAPEGKTSGGAPKP